MKIRLHRMNPSDPAREISNSEAEIHLEPENEIILGRGPILQIDSTTISRKHVGLRVSGSRLILTCNHNAPIYLRHSVTDVKTVVKKNHTEEINDGDIVMFTETDYHYRVRIYNETTSDTKTEFDGEEENKNEISKKKRKLPDWMMEDKENNDENMPGAVETSSNKYESPRKGKKKTANYPELNSAAKILKKLKVSPEKAAKSDNSSEFAGDESVSKGTDDEASGSASTTPSKNATGCSSGTMKEINKKNSPNREKTTKGTSESPSKGDAKPSPSKMGTTESPPKTGTTHSPTKEAGASVTTRHEVSDDDDSSSNDPTQESQGTGSNSHEASGAIGEGSSESSRPSCQYGSSCYRKNPQHRRDLAHPGDDDYIAPVASNQSSDEEDGDDDRPECEFGLNCYRKNPDHKKQYKHTRMPQPRRRAKAAKKKKPTDDEYDSDFINDDSEDYEPVDDSDEDANWEPVKSSDDE